jgi:hypothetical protein
MELSKISFYQSREFHPIFQPYDSGDEKKFKALNINDPSLTVSNFKQYHFLNKTPETH